MRGPPPPLRFLALVLCGWICLRGGVLASGWWEEQEQPYPPRHGIAAAAAAPVVPPLPQAIAETAMSKSTPTFFSSPPPAPGGSLPLPVIGISMVAASATPAAPATAAFVAGRPAPAASPLALPPPPQDVRRWSGSAWLFAREGKAAPLVPGGTLGGSQAGARLTYRINDDADRPLALSGRIYAPLDEVAGAEAALGIDWQPLQGLPVHLLAERRQALGDEGRSAFSLTLYGGVSDEKVGPLRFDAYAQAGVVGARSRDLFADGSARLSLPVGDVRVGAGAWGAAQPGAKRLDVGPQVSVALPVAGANVVVSLDWRLRVAGEAAPESGPTLTLSTGF